MERTLTPLKNYTDLKAGIESAGAWFIGSFMLEFIDNYEKFQEKDSKREFIEYLKKEYWLEDDIHQLRNRINIAIRIIESDMVEEAMEYVLITNDSKLGCDESKINALYTLDCLKAGNSRLPVFTD